MTLRTKAFAHVGVRHKILSQLRVKLLTCVIALGAIPMSVADVNDLDDLQHQLSRHHVVRGDFTQLRHLEMFKQPLSSTGRFTLDKEEGLLWSQSNPFPVNLVLTKNKLSQTFSNQPAQVITANENPMAFYFSHIFLSVFHGDAEKLKDQFDLSFSNDGPNWSLKLIPNQAPLNAVFSQINLEGSQDIDALTLIELRGDKTEILFSNQNHQPETLTDDEQAQFEF